MSTTLRRQDYLRAAALISPAYAWLTVAVFLPLAVMLFFSLLSEAPFGEREWFVTFANYLEFFEKGFISSCYCGL